MIPEWLQFDKYIVEFVKYNLFTISSLFAILIGLAKMSKRTWDEQLLDIIIAPFKTLIDSLSSKK